MALTETGHRVLGYAEEVFSLGQELLDDARQRPGLEFGSGAVAMRYEPRR